MEIVIDTSVIIALANEEADKDIDSVERIFRAIERGQARAWISSITVAEIYALYAKEGEIERAGGIVAMMKKIGVGIVQVSEDIAKEGGVLKGEYRNITGFSTADGIISATARKAGAIVITYDPGFSSIEGIVAKKPEEIVHSF